MSLVAFILPSLTLVASMACTSLSNTLLLVLSLLLLWVVTCLWRILSLLLPIVFLLVWEELSIVHLDVLWQIQQLYHVLSQLLNNLRVSGVFVPDGDHITVRSN